MKIFNRGNDPKQPAPAPAGPAALAAPAPPPAAPPAPAPVPAPVAAPPAPPAPDLTLVLDANVKEMSEKIARLASTVETTATERGSFEAKLEQMEERMRKLSSLTEMISAQYNPFVGDAPAEREAPPKPEVGLAAPPELVSTVPAPPAMTIAIEPPAMEEVALDAPPAVLEAPPQMAPPAPVAIAAAPGAPSALVESVPAGFESSMLLLGWADMLLKSAGTRDALLELANYYHNIGWIGTDARERLLAYADGLSEPASGASRDWRADVEVHEKSLLFVEKLRNIAGRRS